MTFKPWEVWTAKVKYEDSNKMKPRPVLILDQEGHCIICLKMTKHDPRDAIEYSLRDWQQVGLEYPTTVRIGKVLQLEEKDMKRKIGNLSAFDILEVQNRLR